MVQLGARPERAHCAVCEFAGPVRRAHQQPLDGDRCAEAAVRTPPPVPPLVRRQNAVAHRPVKAEALRDPRSRDEVPAVMTNRDARIVQEPHGDHAAALLRAKAEAASHLVRKVRDARRVPPGLLLRDVERPAEVRQDLDAPDRTQQPRPREREVGV